jgi:hypothetical protein
MDIGLIGAGILNGAIAGVGYGFSGWMVLGHDEGFDGPKFLRAIAIGIVVGIYSALSGLPMPLAETNMHSQLGNLGILAGASGFLDQVCVWLWQRIKGKKPWKGGPTVEEIAPKAVETLGGALKERVESAPKEGEIAKLSATGYAWEGNTAHSNSVLTLPAIQPIIWPMSNWPFPD